MTVMRDRSGILSTRRVGASAPRLAGLALLAFLLVAAEPAATRTITLRWRHAGEAAGFKVYTRHADQAYGVGIDVGLPEQVDGVFSYRLEVSNMDATFVSITAYARDGTESPRSNEEVFLLPE
jgi:hypothetical protein